MSVPGSARTVALSSSMQPLHIESLDHEGKGIGRRDGKTIFVDGALTGESVIASSYRKKPEFEQAQATQIVKSSPYRVTPKCALVRRVRRLHASASGRVGASRRQAAGAGGLFQTYRQGQAGIDIVADSRSDLGLPYACAPVRSKCAEEGRCAGRIP
jgi:predicted RNA-binding protein with TRAM domain